MDYSERNIMQVSVSGIERFGGLTSGDITIGFQSGSNPKQIGPIINIELALELDAGLPLLDIEGAFLGAASRLLGRASLEDQEALARLRNIWDSKAYHGEGFDELASL